MKFRKKPVVVEAEQFDGTVEEANRIGLEVTVTEMGVRTLEGFMKASPGDWIITGVKGERYSCKPDIFEKTYEPVSEVDSTQDPMLQFFKYSHLPEKMQDVSRPFGQLAVLICETLPRNPERTVALRKLLEAKDCAVRSTIYK
jgi:hypothetical protein